MSKALCLLTIFLIAANGWAGENDVVFDNRTDLVIARLIVGDRTLEGMPNDRANGKIFVRVNPRVQHLKIVFRGGAASDWPKFNFHGIHEVIFDRNLNQIIIHVK